MRRAKRRDTLAVIIFCPMSAVTREEMDTGNINAVE